MKRLVFSSVFFLSINILFSQLPSELPKNLINKVFCGNTRVTGYYLGKLDYNFWTTFDYKVFISEEDGIYVEYNPGQKFGRDEMGKTDMIKSLPLWTKEPYTHTDDYGDVIGKRITYKYKVYPNTKNDHHIKAVSLTVYEDGFVFLNGDIAKGYSRLEITINVPNHQDAQLIIDSKGECGKLKSKLEVQKEEEERIRIENENIEADKKVLTKINELISKNSLESAVIEYSHLKLKYPELREKFQLALINQYKDSVFTLSQDQIRIYIQEYINQIKRREIEVKRENEIRNRNFQVVKNGLIKIKPGIYNVKFDISGNPNNKELNLNSDAGEYFNDLDFEIEKNIGEFKVRLNSTAQFTIENKDSILINTIFYSSENKQIFCDKNENFYFKTKNSLPVATIKYDEEVPLKIVKIEKIFKSEKYVNGILIDSNVFKTEKMVEIQKKD